jgi:phenylpropionate dioxygenase-like ring-hydroxylating dioxygenase large terminal subunit
MAAKLENQALHTFNRSDRFPVGWYWALPAKEVKRKKAVCATVSGKELVIFRGEDGQAVALDAYCAHRGSHLGLGKVEGNSIRCGYHRWKYDGKGQCVDIPCRETTPQGIGVQRWPTEERYGLIWIWTGLGDPDPLFEVPELEGLQVDSAIANSYTKKCHPNVVMSDAIDTEHFRSVHQIPGEFLDMQTERINGHSLHFHNVACAPKTHWFGQLLGLFYKGPLTYALTYWYGSTGSITVGPDFLHFHVIFTNRVGQNGCSEGQVILLTKKRSGLFGRTGNALFLFLSKMVSNYFGRGDTPQFEHIQFDFKNPIKEDQTLISFVQHVESMPVANWGFSQADGQSDSKTALATNETPQEAPADAYDEEHDLHQIAHSRAVA